MGINTINKNNQTLTLNPEIMGHRILKTKKIESCSKKLAVRMRINVYRGVDLFMGEFECLAFWAIWNEESCGRNHKILEAGL